MWGRTRNPTPRGPTGCRRRCSTPCARSRPDTGRSCARGTRISRAASVATTSTSCSRRPVSHVARALVGTESTCGVVTEATLRLQASPRVRRLVVLGYPDVFAAADAVPSLVEHPLLALEGFDGALVDQMRAHGLNTEHLSLLPDGRGWLLAELGADPGRRRRCAGDPVRRSHPARRAPGPL